METHAGAGESQRPAAGDLEQVLAGVEEVGRSRSLAWLGPAGDALIDDARLRPTSHVLDVASGTGEPGLSAAARSSQGQVTITDLAAKMLQCRGGECRRAAASGTSRRGRPTRARCRSPATASTP